MLKGKIVINKEDMVRYVQIKGIEDYTYMDMVTTLKSGNYDNVPEEFLHFIGRTIEDTIMRIYPRSNTEDYELEGDMYVLPKMSSYQMIVQYKKRDKVDLVGYRTGKILARFDRVQLENFVDKYMDWASGKLIRLTEDGALYEDPQIGMELMDNVFQVISKINLYINKELNQNEGKNSTSIRSRIDTFMCKYQKEAQEKGIETIENLDKWLTYRFDGYDRL